MSGWGPPDGGHKRRAEQSLQVASKRHHLGNVNPGREYVEPRVYQQPSYALEQEQQQVSDHRSTSVPYLAQAVGSGLFDARRQLQEQPPCISQATACLDNNQQSSKMRLVYFMDDLCTCLQGTDFNTWSEADIKAFLDERGGDFDDCTNFQQLVRDSSSWYATAAVGALSGACMTVYACKQLQVWSRMCQQHVLQLPGW